MVPAFSLLQERIFLTLSNYIFTAVFLAEMTVKVGGGCGTGSGPLISSGCGDNRTRREWVGRMATVEGKAGDCR